MGFEIIGRISKRIVIASGPSLRERLRLRKLYGRGRWRKVKGRATILVDDGTIVEAELHWYEAHGYGKKEMKIKRFLD